MATINLNVSPYFDDYSEDKDYLRVLFRPGFAVQARELTQLQTILQNQISRFGNHIFKDGSVVTDGNIHLNNEVFAMNLISTEGDVDFPLSSAEGGSTEASIDNLSGLIISNGDQTVKAKVLTTPTGIDGTLKSGFIYISYLTQEKFSDSDTQYVYARSEDNTTQSTKLVNVFNGVTPASLAIVQSGIYYVDGFFTRVTEQNVVVSNTTNKPTATIGFAVSSKAVTSNDDATLFDNARGSTNEGAPGANRLQNSISVVIKSAADQGSDPTFFKQLDVVNGVIQGVSNTNPDAATPNPQYASLGDTFAQRTREESGSYTITPFTPRIVDRLYDSENFAISLSKGLAYVNGYRVETLDDTQVLIDRNLENELISNYSWNITGVPYVEVTSTGVAASRQYGTLPGFGDSDANQVFSYETRVSLKDSDGLTIGYATPYMYERRSANMGRLYLADISMFTFISTNDSETAYSTTAGQVIETPTAIGTVVALDGNGAADSDWSTKVKTADGLTQNAGPKDVRNNGYNAGFLVENVNGRFDPNQTIEAAYNTVNGQVIQAAVPLKFSRVREIRGNIKSGAVGGGNPEFRVLCGSDDSETLLKNINSALISFVDENVQTMRSGIEAIDNDFEMLYRNPPTITSTSGGLTVTPATDERFNGASGEFFNGSFKKARVDDAVETTKTLKFAFLKIRNTDDFTRTSTQASSWSAADRQINLYYPDVHEIYGIAKGQKTNSFDADTPASEPNAGFTRINVTVSDGTVIPQGSIITGKKSGTRAIVALENATAVGETNLASDAEYHKTRKGTGSTGKLEIVFQKGVAFETDETIRVVAPADSTFSGADVTFAGIDGTRLAGQDVSQNYLWDGGQRPNFLKVGSIIRKDGVPSPGSGDLVVFFSYFEADPTDSFFSNVDSYAGSDFFKIDTRYFLDPQEIKNFKRYNGLNLRNAVDFRLRQKLNGGASISNNPLAFTNTAYFDTGSIIIPDSRFTSDTRFYLKQFGSIFLTNSGNFKYVEGAASFTPEFPPAISDSMLIANVGVPSAVRYPEVEVAIETSLTRRYTMSDIQEIAERLSNVEEAVSLSLLETQALLENTDDKFKTGFIVDDFSTQTGSSDTQNPEFSAQIDDETGVLRPGSIDDFFATDTKVTSNIDDYYLGQGPGYVIKSYEQEQMLQQEFASSTIRVNPYATWVYQGTVDLTPTQDFWKDPTATVVENLLIDRTSFGGGIEAVNEKTFKNLKSVTTNIPGSKFTKTSSQVIGKRKSVTKKRVNKWERDRLRAQGVPQTSKGLILKTTTTKTTKIKTTKTYVKQQTESTQKEFFQEREVREIDDAWMRSIGVITKSEGLRPSVNLKVVFDGVDVTQYCQQVDFDIDAVQSPDATFGSLGSIVSDSRGRVQFRFNIPGQTFKTGSKRLVITDADNSNTTEAVGTFTSRGFYSVGDLVKIRVQTPAGNKLIGNKKQVVTETKVQRQLYDPVAQAFTLPLDAGADPNNFDPNVDVPRDSGSFITSVDVWFGFVDDRALQNRVTCQIRNMINGYPGPEVLGESTLNISKSASENLTQPVNATNFRLDAPCYLEANTEYAIVLLTPSDKTTVWTAVQGENDITTGGKIDAQPNVGGYYGSFFKSQNNSTWTADQNRDLTFRAYRAKFDTDESSITLKEENNFFIQPIGQAQRGLAFETFENTNYIKVYHPNHGMYGPNETHKVRIQGVEHNFVVASTDSDIQMRGVRTLNGIPVDKINNVSSINNVTADSDGNTHKVYFATQNAYFIKIEGDSEGLTQSYIRKSFAGLGGGNNAVATSNIQFDIFQTNLIPTIFEGTNVSQTVQTKRGHIVNLKASNDQISYDVLNIHHLPFGSRTSEITVPVDEVIPFGHPQIILGALNKTGTDDFTHKITLTTDNEYLSPVFRLDSAQNIFTTKNIGGRNITDSDVSTSLNVRTNLVGDSDGQRVETAAYRAGLQSVNEVGTYISKVIDLELPATQIRVFFEADMNPDNELIVKYKIRKTGEQTTVQDKQWQTFNRNQIVNETNFGAFSSDIDFREYELLEDIGDEFDSLILGIELKSGNEALVPEIKNLRIITTV